MAVRLRGKEIIPALHRCLMHTGHCRPLSCLLQDSIPRSDSHYFGLHVAFLWVLSLCSAYLFIFCQLDLLKFLLRLAFDLHSPRRFPNAAGEAVRAAAVLFRLPLVAELLRDGWAEDSKV